MTMGNFNAKISAEFTPPKTWVLNRELSFQTNEFTKEANDIFTKEKYFTRKEKK